MKTELPIAQAYTITTRDVYEDGRGLFCEIWRKNDSTEKNFLQRNVSVSKKNVLRGMHSMTYKAQAKLVTCIYGQVLDVIVDARRLSPTFKCGYALTLDYKKMNSIYVPPGVLHGFLVLSEVAVVEYDCSNYFEKRYDGGARWDSPEIKKYFPKDLKPVLSSKDDKLPSFEEFVRQKG
ncbi:MAG: dTDP-4-dehydrorhamnose 3,5-epimerase family protein [Flavobacteriaceae bacterium]